MWSANKYQPSHSLSSCQRILGFTLLEMVMALTIVGFMTVAVGSGIVYGVKIYKATQSANAVMPQVATALNVLRHRVMHEGPRSLRGNHVKLNKGVLLLDNAPLLHHVAGFKLEENVPVYGGGALTRIKITLQPEVIGGTHTFTVEVANE